MNTMQPTRTSTTCVRVAFAVVATLALVAALLAVGMSPTGAQDAGPHDAHGSIEAVPLTEHRHSFPDDVAVQVRDRPDGRSNEVVNLRDASSITVVEITIPPGAQFPWHTHPGPVLAAVAEGDDDGAFIYVYADDCVERHYEAGEAFVDPGGTNVHMAYNPSPDQTTVVIATFIGVPEEGPLTIPVSETEGADLDDGCGIER